MVKSLPCKAGDEGCTPHRGTKISHAMGQLNPCTATRETVSCNQDPMQLNKQIKKRKRKVKCLNQGQIQRAHKQVHS